MTLYQKIHDFLENNKIDFNESHHEAVFTSEQAAAARGNPLEEGAKALIFWADNEPIQIVINANKKVDKDIFKTLFGYSKLKMVSAEEVEQIASVKPGAVPPFGILFENPIKVYANQELLKNEFIEFNAGDHSVSIRMKTNDWVKIVKPTIGEY